MRNRVYLAARVLITIVASAPILALGHTLIVTHPDTQFDVEMASGLGTESLLKAPTFRRKLVLLNDGGVDRLTFSPIGLNFETMHSDGGEFRWDDSDNEVTVGGGNLTSCLGVTIANLAQFSEKSLIINIEMVATYSHVSSFLRLAGFEVPQTVGYRVSTLAQFRQEYGEKALIELARNLAANVYRQIAMPMYVHNGRSNDSVEVRAFLMQREVGKIGQGSQTIKLNLI